MSNNRWSGVKQSRRAGVIFARFLLSLLEAETTRTRLYLCPADELWRLSLRGRNLFGREPVGAFTSASGRDQRRYQPQLARDNSSPKHPYQGVTLPDADPRAATPGAKRQDWSVRWLRWAQSHARWWIDSRRSGIWSAPPAAM